MGETKTRQSNFECLRILSMIVIIFSHLMGQTGAVDATVRFNKLFSIVSGSASRIAVAIFVMIGSWFMVERKMQASRILRIWGEVFFYTVVITATLYLLGYPVTKVQLISAFFPFLRRPLWFAGAYIALMLLSPFLNEILTWGEKKQARLIITLSIVVVLVSTTSRFMDTYLCNVCGFVYLYLLTGFYKFNIHKKANGRQKNSILFIVWSLYLILAVIKWFTLIMIDSGAVFQYANKVATQYLSDFKSLPNLIIAIGTFYYFANTDMGSNKLINFISKSAFGVYIIHQTPAFITVLWNEVFKVVNWINSKYFILFSLITVLLVYLGGLIIDNVREILERIWTKSKVFYKLSGILDRVLSLK